jgi:hypothetical protein
LYLCLHPSELGGDLGRPIFRPVQVMEHLSV